MGRAFVLMSILFFAGVMSAPAEEVIPQRLEFKRYEPMLKRSPFAVATAPMPAAAAPSWSKDLYVANAAHTPSVDMVTVMSLSDKGMKEYLTTEGPNQTGYAIANIEWSDTPGETKVTISKSGQFATIGFNEALLQENAHTSATMPSPMVKPRPPFNRYPQPVQGFPAPHTRGVIPRNPSGVKSPFFNPPQTVAPVNQEPPPTPPPGQ